MKFNELNPETGPTDMHPPLSSDDAYLTIEAATLNVSRQRNHDSPVRI